MFTSFLSADLGLDLGSSCVRAALQGQQTATEVPAAVALRQRRSGRREIVALGEDALAMLGRTPDGLEVVRPVRSGRIVAPEVAEALVRHLLREVDARRWGRRRVTLAIDPDLPPAEARTLRQVVEAAGAHEVATMPAPLAAALGADIDPGGSAGHMIVDVGSGTTSIAVVCSDAVVSSAALDIAGDVFDGAVIRHLVRTHGLLVGPATAEALKRELGAALVPEAATSTVAGRCLRAGTPRAQVVHAEALAEALVEPVAALGSAVRRVLEQTPPEVAADVVDHGVLLTGAGARLANLDLALRAATGLAFLPVDGGDRAVIRGVARHLAPRRLRARTAAAVPALAPSR
ncbi:MAG: rod shape-determining protein [Alphaproteobacteria bacterium]|nr:rod shape-determining protein [Alphaproteobacteria bacterium]